MPRIVIKPNQGENPIAGWGNDAGWAACAINTKFWHGLLQPFQCPKLHCCRDFDIKTLYSLDECDCIAWDTEVSIADCFCDFIFWTDDGKPQISTHEELCEGESCDLGVPCPTNAPTVKFAKCVDERAPCIDACDTAYDKCKAAAVAACDELQAEVDALREAYGECLRLKDCPEEGEDPPDDCGDARKEWQEKQNELNRCLRCQQDDLRACRETRDRCKDACPEESCCDKQCVQFVYRYVNKYGQPGAPSKPSTIQEIALNSTDTISISGIERPPGNHCITHVEIFMTIAGNKTGLENPVKPNSGFMSMGVYSFAESFDMELGEPGLELDSWNYFPPPENLEGIQCTDMGLVGFEGKNIWYTEPNQPHAWSKKKCLDHTVKGLKYWNGILFAATDSWLYRMNLSQDEGSYEFSAPFRYGERPMPLLSDQRGMSAGQAGVFYPSVMGGVLATEGSARYITSKFGKDDWMGLNPKTMQTAVFDYGVGFFSCNASYVYEWGDGTFGELEGHLYQLPFKPNAVYTDKNGILNYAVGNKWYRWDACYRYRNPCDDCETISIECCPYKWEGEEVVFDTQARLTAGFIEFVPGTGDVTLEIFEEDYFEEPIYKKTFNEGTERCRKNRLFRKYFRLPSCRVEDQIFIRLTGCAHVRQVVLGTSRSALHGSTG